MHGYAAVDDVTAPVGHDVGDGTAAALVDLAKFPDLPGNFFFVEDAADLGHEFGVGIVAAGLAAGAGVFAQADTVAELGRILFFIGVGKDRVKGGADVGRQDFAVAQGPAQPDFLVMALEGQEFGDEVREVRRLDARVADGTDFFFIGKEGDLCLFPRYGIEDGGQVGIRADAVIMAVGHDHRPVQADVAALDGRDDFQFSTGEIFFFNTVFFL